MVICSIFNSDLLLVFKRVCFCSIFVLDIILVFHQIYYLIQRFEAKFDEINQIILDSPPKGFLLRGFNIKEHGEKPIYIFLNLTF